MTSFQATVVYQRAGNDVAVAGLVCTRTLAQYDVINKYDVISSNSGVPVGWRVWRGVWAGQRTGLACPLSQYVTSLVNMTSFQATVVYQRAGNEVAVAGLAGSWAEMSVLCV
jgi:hypothetical protein